MAVRRKAGIGEPSFYAQRKKVWWADAVRVKRLKQLEVPRTLLVSAGNFH